MRCHRTARPPARRVHLVDVENLAGTGRLTRAIVSACCAAYGELGLLGPEDHVIVGCSPMSQVEVGLGWRGPRRIVVGHGADGADRALLEVVARERVGLRFDEAIVASGDGIFADCTMDLARRGMRVTVVSRAESLSNRLRAAVHSRPVIFPAAQLVEAAAMTTDLELAA